MEQKKLGTIAFVPDDRLSRERAQIVMRTINALRTSYHVDLLPPLISEEEVFRKLEENQYSLVLVPWYNYMAWGKVEGFYGLTRTSGPTFAGYFADRLQPHELGSQADHLRAILIDLYQLQPKEAVPLIHCIIQENLRSGIRPLHDPGTLIYCENWFTGQGNGLRTDTVLGLQEIATAGWVQRKTEIRAILSALWSLIYEEGPGKGDFAQPAITKTPRASFQMGADTRFLSFRLVYSMSSWTPKKALSVFWPDPARPMAASQVLLRYSDFLRIHTISDTNDVELVVGLFPSGEKPRALNDLRTLWIEPIAPQLISELPFESPNPNEPHLRVLPTPQASQSLMSSSQQAQIEQTLLLKEKHLFDAALKIRELQTAVNQRDEIIKELRSGGVGVAPQLAPADGEGLLDAFQERFFDIRYQIDQIEVQVLEAQTTGASPQQIEALRQKIQHLTQRELAWMQKIASLIETYRSIRKRDGTHG